MSFDPDTDDVLKAILDSGFLPPHEEALTSVINAVMLWTRLDEERASTPDGLLLDVLISFNEIISEIVSAAELPAHGPSIALPFSAARHTLAIADALTLLAHREGTPPPVSLAEDDLRARWVEAIIGLCQGAGLPAPCHLSANGYVCISSGQLNFAVKALRANPRVSLSPGDPILADHPIPSPDDRQETDPDLAARCLAWQGAAAICMAACVCPEFRFGVQPSRN
ncbi:MAG: hypothetical protein ACLPUT_10475 [Solirubrobacteraceae bacterium]